MRIVIDEKIPFIRGAFEPWADVVYSPARAIDSDMVRDAQALIVRTRTKCNSHLLEGSSVKIIASATIGYDHIDTEWLGKEGIRWISAPGCNSGSVMQYIVAALFHLSLKHTLDLSSLTLGVVGVGNVGSKVVRAAKALGMNVLQNDPPRQRREGLNEFMPLKALLDESDILTLHVPLTMEGEDKTHYLINSDNLPRLKKNCFLINTSRGEVVDNTALRNALSDNFLKGAVLDVWEGEPEADRRLISMAELATPHIAGYSVDGKANATIAVVREVSSLLDIPLVNWFPDELPEPDEPLIDLGTYAGKSSVQDMVAMAVRHTYPIDEDDRLFRSDPGRFEFLRDNYRKRREFSSFSVIVNNSDAERSLRNLGFNIIKKFKTQ
jgi:erythronate-4-phosphate dehydrogenase